MGVMGCQTQARQGLSVQQESCVVPWPSGSPEARWSRTSHTAQNFTSPIGGGQAHPSLTHTDTSYVMLMVRVGPSRPRVVNQRTTQGKLKEAITEVPLPFPGPGAAYATHHNEVHRMLTARGFTTAAEAEWHNSLEERPQ
ncbi:unnamed protein product [Boreogadus saida]